MASNNLLFIPPQWRSRKLCVLPLNFNLLSHFNSQIVCSGHLEDGPEYGYSKGSVHIVDSTNIVRFSLFTNRNWQADSLAWELLAQWCSRLNVGQSSLSQQTLSTWTRFRKANLQTLIYDKCADNGRELMLHRGDFFIYNSSWAPILKPFSPMKALSAM